MDLSSLVALFRPSTSLSLVMGPSLAALLALPCACWLAPARPLVRPCVHTSTTTPRALAPTLQAADFAGLEFAYVSESHDDEYPEFDEDETLDLGGFGKEPSLPLANMTVAALQAELKLLGLRSTGRKADLIERIENARRKKAAGVPVHALEVHQDRELKWYMVQTANGFEKTVSTTIRQSVEVQARLEKRNGKRGLISDVWGKRGATYGEKGVCRRVQKLCLVPCSGFVLCRFKQTRVFLQTHTCRKHACF